MTDSSVEEYNPRFRRKDTRVEIALAKFHGVGDDEPWSIERIADYLGVSPRTVSNYVENSDMADEVEEAIADAQVRTRMRIATKLMKRLDDLEEKIDQLSDEKRPAVVSHRYERVKGTISMKKDGMTVTDENEATFTVPIPDKFTEVPEVTEDLKTLMREWRQTVQQVEDLLGLEAPDQIESEHREIQAEVKLFRGLEDNPFPEQEILDSPH